MSNVEPLSQRPINTLDCRFCELVLKSGTGRAAHERHCVKNPNYVPSKAKLKQLAHLENPNNQCPECAAEGVEKGFTNAGSLGTHRRSQHGVVGRVTLEAKVACTYVDENGVACKFKGKSHSGMLIHYTRKHANDLVSVPAVLNGNGHATNGHSPAELRRSMRNQLQNRADLVAVARIVWPHSIPTEDEQELDSALSYIAQTAQMLESR